MKKILSIVTILSISIVSGVFGATAITDQIGEIAMYKNELAMGLSAGAFVMQMGFDATGTLMALTYGGLQGPNGLEDNIGGLTKRFWFAPKSYFTTIQAVKDLSDGTATSTTIAEIASDHVFASGKGFHVCYCTRDMGEVKYTGAGERDGRSIVGKGTFFVPGLKSSNIGQLRMMKNDELIILAEAADGKVLQLGSVRFPAEVRVSEGGTAKNESGVRGFMIEVDAFESGPQIYTGAITTI
jgi:hypothetical protein